MEKSGERRVIHRNTQNIENVAENKQIPKGSSNDIERKLLIKKWIKRGVKIAILLVCFLYLQHTYKLLNQYNNFYFSSLKGFPTSDANLHCGIDLDDDNAVDYKDTHLEYVDSEWNDDTVVFNFKFTNKGDKSVAFNQIYSVVCIDPEVEKNSEWGRYCFQAVLDVIGKAIVGDLHKSTDYDGMINVDYDVPTGETVDVHVCFDVSSVDERSCALMLVKPKYYFALLLDGSASENHRGIESLGSGVNVYKYEGSDINLENNSSRDSGNGSIVNLGNGGQP